MKLKLNCGRVCLYPETAAEGLHIGRFFAELPVQAKRSISLLEDCIAFDYVQLNIVDDCLQWMGTDCGRIDRIQQLLMIEAKWKRLPANLTSPDALGIAPWLPGDV